jgi:hypothetical protein
MGEEPHRLMETEAPDRPSRIAPEDVKRLESEIERSRRRLDAYVDELDRRRHRLLSVRRHPLPALGFAAGAAAIVAGAVWLGRRRSTRTARSRRKARSLRDALRRVAAHPERVASEGKSPWSRALVAAAPVVAKFLADAALRRRR